MAWTDTSYKLNVRTTTTTSVTSWVKTSPMFRGGVFGPFRSVGTLKGAFLLPETASAFFPRCFPAFLFRRRCLDCVKFGGWLVLVPSPLSDPGNVAFVPCDATLCCVWCGSTLAGSCRHVRFQLLWFFAALLCGDALTATERVLERHRVGSAGWVLSSMPWRRAMKMYLRVGAILEVDCWIDAPVLLS